jgi:hypothetical protein
LETEIVVTIIASVCAVVLLLANVIALLLLVIAPFFFFLVFQPYSTAADRLATACSWAVFFLFCELIVASMIGTFLDGRENGFGLNTALGFVSGLLRRFSQRPFVCLESPPSRHGDKNLVLPVRTPPFPPQPKVVDPA